LFYGTINRGNIVNKANKVDRHRARLSDDQSLIKARYCKSIMNVTSISTDAEASILITGLTNEQPTSNTSAPMAEAERAALAAIRILAGLQHGRSVPQTSHEWLRAVRAVEYWVSIHDR
jgi:hypothetical protein